VTLSELPPGDDAGLVTWLGGRVAALTEAPDLETLAQASIREVRAVVDAEYIAFYLSDPGSEQLRMFAQHGFTPEEREEAERTAHERHPGAVVRTRTMLHVPDIQEAPQQSRTDQRRRHEIRSRLFLPLESEGLCIGTLGIASTRPHHFSPLHIASLEFLCRFVGIMHRNLWRLGALEQRVHEVHRQQEELRELSAPISELDAGILLLPVIGRVDAARGDELTERLLQAAASRRARVVLLDLTGLAGDDGGALVFLERVGKALALLGVACLFSGVSPSVARGAAEAGVELGQGRCHGSLTRALQAARRLGS
jgi:anti-anti-sigma regulatory factor/putative methionine-R-sulfoxide reductase with GAF domain